MNKLKCPICGGYDLVLYEEKIIIYETPILKSGKLPKSKKKTNEINDNKHIDCLKCSSAFKYNIDLNGNIVNLVEYR